MWSSLQDPWTNSFYSPTHPNPWFYRENPFSMRENPICHRQGKPRRVSNRNTTRRCEESQEPAKDTQIPVHFSFKEEPSTRKPRVKTTHDENLAEEPQQLSSQSEFVIQVRPQQEEERDLEESLRKEHKATAEENTDELKNSANNYATDVGSETDAVQPNKQQTNETNETELRNDQTSPAAYKQPETQKEDSRSPETKKLDAIESELMKARELIPRVEAFQGSKGDKEYVYLEEMLTRCILGLDLIETDGVEEVRSARRAAVKEIVSVITSNLESRVSSTSQ